MANKSYEEILFTAIKNGQTAKSVYDIWIELGNTGTPADFLNSLKGSTPVIVKATTIVTTDWAAFEGVYKATILNELITSNSVVNVNFDATSLDDAINSGVLGYTNTIDGGFEIYSNFKPTVDLVIDYVMINE